MPKTFISVLFFRFVSFIIQNTPRLISEKAVVAINLAKMYQRFFERGITRYNGRWYCYPCKTTLQNLTEAQRHSEEAHSTISTQTSGFLNKFVTLRNKGYRMLLQHGIVRDTQRDYFCIYCQCSISSLHYFYQHSKEQNHQKYMKSILKRSTNEQQNSRDKTNNKQSNTFVNVENSTEHMNKSKMQPICENKLIKDGTNDSTQTASRIIESAPCALMQEVKTHKHFLDSAFQSFTDLMRHSQEAHSDVNPQISGFWEKSIESSGIIRRKLLNHERAMQDMPEEYFCKLCQCPIPSLDHCQQHLNGKRHKCMIESNEKDNTIIPEDLGNKQQNVNKNTTDNQDISVNAFDGNDSIRNLQSNFRTEEESTVSVKSYNEDSINDGVLQIKRRIDIMTYCCFCDAFIYKTIGNNHEIDTLHSAVLSKLKIFNREAACTINLEEEKKTIRPIQLNSKKFDGTAWPEYTETAAKYTCDHCNKVIEEDDIINHEITVHKSDMTSSMKYIYDWSSTTRDFNITIHYPLFRCSFCNEIIHGVLSLSNHFLTFKHKENIKSLTDIKRREDDSCKDIQIYLEPFEFLSIISFENNGGTVQIMEQPVIYIKNHYTTFCENTIENKFIYVCLACSYNACETHKILDHLCKTSKHLKHFKNIFLTYNYIHNVSVSKDLSTNGTREIESQVSKEDISIDNGSFVKHNISETQVNAELCHNNSSIAAANISSRNDESCQNEENDSGLFISLDIFEEIDTSVKYINVPFRAHLMNKKSVNKITKSDRYNKAYSRKFLEFEEVMFACNERKLKEMKSHLQFFVPHLDKMLCLVCNGSPQLCSAQAIYEHINCVGHVRQFEKLHENKEHLELLKELIQPLRDSSAKCFACNKILNKRKSCKNDNVYFKNHTHFPSHKNAREQLLGKAVRVLEEFQNLWYDIQYFACVECGKRFKRKITFLEHLDAAHRKVLNNKDNSMFDFCLTCATLWFKNESCAEDIRMSYQAHCHQQTHQYLRKTNDLAVTSLPQSLQNLLKNVNGTAADLFKLSVDVKNDRKVNQLTDALRHIFKTHRLPVEVHTFGSRVTGLALPNSDIDVYLNFGDERTEPELIKSRSEQIQDCLRADHENWDIELTLDRSRTPLIKVKHRPTKLQCDISFINGLSVENSKLIKSFNRAYPPCQKLTLFLKKWLSLGGLSGPDGITNYALVWLVIFYLQIKFAAVPNIAALIESHNQSKIVSGWETGVGDTILINLPKLSIRDLSLGFFEYYGSFNYMHSVICPLLGKTCPKKAFAEVSTLPNSMAPYVTKLRNEKPEYFRIDSHMCVQDPFDLSHNLTKAVPVLTLKCFKHYCNESLSVLRNVTATSLKKKFREMKLF
ncbi:uncharacterized protein LOC143898644 isoform X1 [Temnothorax americanus]|uniref:uncharacterized protein LOC143898644 isoform X1 n=2 Tax=Temnothorax americanus TaxID=1964332 RepID=UPI004067B1D3